MNHLTGIEFAAGKIVAGRQPENIVLHDYHSCRSCSSHPKHNTWLGILLYCFYNRVVIVLQVVDCYGKSRSILVYTNDSAVDDFVVGHYVVLRNTIVAASYFHEAIAIDSSIVHDFVVVHGSAKQFHSTAIISIVITQCPTFFKTIVGYVVV